MLRLYSIIISFVFFYYANAQPFVANLAARGDILLKFDQNGFSTALNKGTPFDYVKYSYSNGNVRTLYNDENGEPLLFSDGQIILDYKFRELNNSKSFKNKNWYNFNVFIVPHLTKENIYWFIVARQDKFYDLKTEKVYSIFLTEIYANKKTDEFKIIQENIKLTETQTRGVSVVYQKEENAYLFCTVDDYKTCACYKMTECGLDPKADKEHKLALNGNNMYEGRQKITIDQRFIFRKNTSSLSDLLEVYKFDSISRSYNYWYSIPDLPQYLVDSLNTDKLNRYHSGYEFSINPDSRSIIFRSDYRYSFEYDFIEQKYVNAYTNRFTTLFLGPNRKYYSIILSGSVGNEKSTIYECEFLAQGKVDSTKVLVLDGEQSWEVIELDIPSFYYDSAYRKPTPAHVYKPEISGIRSNPICFKEGLELEETTFPTDSTVWELQSSEQKIKLYGKKLKTGELKSGVYSVKVSNYDGCQKEEKTVIIQLDSDPTVSILGEKPLFLCSGYSKEISIKVNTSTVVWNTGELTNHIVLKNKGLYEVQARNSCGLAKDSIQVEYEEIEIPNVITPNGDDKNETFRVLQTTESYAFSVFNRNGALLFQDLDYQEDWPSTRVADGTYFYEIQTKNQCHYKGWVQLLH